MIEWFRLRVDEDDKRVRQRIEDLRVIESQRGLTPKELVLFADALLIDPDAPEGTKGGPDDILARAKGYYLEALKVDHEYVPGLISLAWYLDAVEGEEVAALPHFQKALACIRRQLLETVVGMAGCLQTLESDEVSRAFLRSMLGADGIMTREDLPWDQQRLLECGDDSEVGGEAWPEK